MSLWGAREKFVVTRFGAGLVGLTCLAPATLLGPATFAGVGAVVAFATYLVAGLLALRGGHSASAAAASALGSAVIVASMAATHGPVAWPLVLLLAAEPIEALWEGRRPAAIAAIVAAAATLLFLALSGWFNRGAATPSSLGVAVLTGFIFLRLMMGSRAAVASSLAAGIPPSAILGAGSPLEAVYDLVTTHDSSGDVVAANDGSRRLLGIAPSGLRGGGLLARVHVSDRPAFLKALSDAANGSETVSVEFRVHAGSDEAESADGPAGRGRVVWAEMRVMRLQASPDSAVVVAVTRDMSTHHQHAEDSEQARRAAEQADELKGRFLATVSHELRTPLNAIIGFSELLAVDHPYRLTEERRKEYAVIIRNSGHHLLEIVNTLLDMSKIETGNFNFLPEPFSFRDLAISCCDLMRLKAEEAKIQLRQRLDGDLPEILADRRACRQILINLLSNAVKFTPAGGTVTISLAREGDFIILEVADTGIGIPESDLPRLGDPFFQSGTVHRRTHEGTGLGLSVVRGLVGLHRGTLRIESGADVGTTVSVALPIEGARAGDASTPVVVQARPRVSPLHLERKSA